MIDILDDSITILDRFLKDSSDNLTTKINLVSFLGRIMNKQCSLLSILRYHLLFLLSLLGKNLLREYERS